MGERREAAVRWSEERRRLTLEGEGVLEYILRWHLVEGAGLGGPGISAYFRRLAGRGGSGRSISRPVWTWSDAGRRAGPSPPGGGS